MQREYRNLLTGNTLDLLFTACENGDVDSFLQQSRGFDIKGFVDIRDMEGLTMIDVAIKNKRSCIVEILLHHGWCVESDIKNCLRDAVSSGCVDTATTILKKCSDFSDDFTIQMLDFSISRRHAPIVELLLSLYPDIDIKRAFVTACVYGGPDIVKFLLSVAESRGYDIPDWLNEDVRVSVHTKIVHNGNAEVVDILIAAGVDFDVDLNAYWLLPAGAGANCVSLVEEILDYYIDDTLSLEDDTLACALGSATANGHTNIVIELLNSGVDLTMLPSQALGHALERGHDETVMVLIRVGLRFDDYRWGGIVKTPLMAAVEGECTEVVRHMLYYTGVDVNYLNVEFTPSRTALSYASKPEIVKMLLDAKASVHPPDGAIHHTAAYNFQPESIKMMMDAGASLRPKGYLNLLSNVVSRSCTEETADAKVAVADLLVHASVEMAGCSADEFDQHVTIPFGNISKDPSTERVVEIFLRYHPRMFEHVDEYGNTPLHRVIMDQRAHLIEYLTNAGVDVNKRNNRSMPLICELLSGDGCLLYSAMSRFFYVNVRATLRAVLDARADLSVSDMHGRTVFMAAVAREIPVSHRQCGYDTAPAAFIRDMAEEVLSRGLGAVPVDEDEDFLWYRYLLWIWNLFAHFIVAPSPRRVS